MTKTKNWLRIIGVLIGSSGLAVLIYHSWQVTLGIILLLWGTNIEINTNNYSQKIIIERLKKALMFEFILGGSDEDEAKKRLKATECGK